jgi:hypothetical protein
MQWEFGAGPMDKVVHHVLLKPHAKFEYFTNLEGLHFEFQSLQVI